MSLNNTVGKPLNILVLGATYGALIAAKVALAGHRVTVVARPPELDAIATNGMRVTFPLRSSQTQFSASFSAQHGMAKDTAHWGLLDIGAVVPDDYDLAFLAMSEPQVGAAPVVDLFWKISAAQLPVVSLLNMPPLSFLARIPGFPVDQVQQHFQSRPAWHALAKTPQTLASPDAQAVRPDAGDATALDVTLASNLKAAPFAQPHAQRILQQLSDDIAKFRLPDGQTVPVRLVAETELMIPFAKTPMLLTGNYRCVTSRGIMSIRDAVWTDIAASRKIYDQCCRILTAYNVPATSLVPFDRYAQAAKSLTRPSSVARALDNGVTTVERADAMILSMGNHLAMDTRTIAPIVDMIDRRVLSPVV